MKKLMTIACLIMASAGVGWGAVGGPVVLMGIDAEDGNISDGAHGGILPYATIVGNILAQVANGGSGILVIGGGKIGGCQDVNQFWNAIGALTFQPVTVANGNQIATQSFAGFALIAVVSSSGEVVCGGLSFGENAAVAARKNDVAAHVNAGGGLLGFCSTFVKDNYGYAAGIRTGCSGETPFTITFLLETNGFSRITPTGEGLALGITDTNLDVCCWHNEFLTFPSYLHVLAVNDATGNACAVGGRAVVIPTALTCPDRAVLECGAESTLIAHIEDPGCADVQVVWKAEHLDAFGRIAQTNVFLATGGSPSISADVSFTHIYHGFDHNGQVTMNNGTTTITRQIALTVQDTLPPVLFCLDTNVANDPGQCSAVVWYVGGGYDLCGAGFDGACNPPSGSVFLVGTTTISCTATDVAGNVGFCTSTVTVEDREPPQIRCPSNMTVPNDPGKCSAVVSYVVTATDNCSIVSVVCTPPSGSVFAKSTTTVNCLATDTAGNTTSCSFTVTVQDKEPPVVSCKPAPNPSGDNVPGADKNSSSGTNPDGYYQLLATDNCDSNPSLFIRDSAGAFVAGPFASDDNLKITQTPGRTPSQKPGPLGTVAHIQLKGDGVLYAVDADGNTAASVLCAVPPSK